jgi:hypothetical protein
MDISIKAKGPLRTVGKLRKKNYYTIHCYQVLFIVFYIYLYILKDFMHTLILMATIEQLSINSSISAGLKIVYISIVASNILYYRLIWSPLLALVIQMHINSILFYLYNQLNFLQKMPRNWLAIS